MKIAALSDFHIGPWDRADIFGHTEDDILRFLDRLESEHDCIVLVGDVFQTQMGLVWGPRSQRRHLELARRRFPRLAERILHEPYRLLYGNHDEVAGPVLGARESVTIRSDGFGALFIHGHQFDEVMNRNLTLSHMSTWTVGRLRFAGLGILADLGERIDVALKHRWYEGHPNPYLDAASKIIEREGVDLVCMAHTHVAQRIELEKGLFVNCGSCSRGRYEYVSVDTKARSVELC